jgi:hypothetical protein
MIADLSLSGPSEIAALGAIVGAIVAVVAYVAFIMGMFGLAEMGRLAKIQRMELEGQRWAREQERRLEAEKLNERQRRLEAARIDEERRSRDATNPASPASALAPNAKIPWWKYAPRQAKR